MARAALLLDGIALQDPARQPNPNANLNANLNPNPNPNPNPNQDPAKRGRIVELGAVPLLLQAIERAADALSADPLAAAPQASLALAVALARTLTLSLTPPLPLPLPLTLPLTRRSWRSCTRAGCCSRGRMTTRG